MGSERLKAHCRLPIVNLKSPIENLKFYLPACIWPLNILSGVSSAKHDKEYLMRQETTIIRMVLIYLAVAGFCADASAGRQKIALEAPVKKVGKYEMLELLIHLNGRYDNPFDPNEVYLTVKLSTPGGEQITLPGFYCQDYERQDFKQERKTVSWFYPLGQSGWKARFSPTEVGIYSAVAKLKDNEGTVQSETVRFECVPSSRKGFVRISRKDPRFLEFTDGAPFFAIGQNLAFIGEEQYVNLAKAEQIFGKLSQNGANFLRIWTCCEDWAMAIEARKSAWDRSWYRKALIVPIPGSEKEPHPRKCVKIEGGDGASVTVSPSHPVSLRPRTRYILTGQFRADGPAGLRVEIGRSDGEQPFDAAPKGDWKKFSREFSTGENDFWLGNIVIRLAGPGTVWLDNLSLTEADGGPELLWEADVNRPIRGFYNQVDCFMLDQLVEAAERNGIYLMLCIITRDLYMKSLSDDQSLEYQQAIGDAKKLMRYVVARWGYSTSVAAWEYFNEIDPGLPTDRFYTELGEYLEQTDIYHHLRTTSTWHPSAKDCRHPKLDVGQLHHYMRPETKEEYKDEVAVVIDKMRFLREHAPSKPVLIGEFGLATPKWGLSEDMKQDTEGIHFHNSLWASAFAGTSGTALFWWWDQLDRQDVYRHYRPLSVFLADVSFAELRHLTASSSDKQVRLLGCQGDNCAFVWLFNPQATWWNLVIEKQKSSEIKDATIEIQGLQPGSYFVEWWHTYEGKVIQKEQVSFTQGPLRVSIPPFSRDIACKIRR
jgi:hypothetical protein